MILGLVRDRAKEVAPAHVLEVVPVEIREVPLMGMAVLIVLMDVQAVVLVNVQDPVRRHAQATALMRAIEFVLPVEVDVKMQSPVQFLVNKQIV